MIKISDLVFRYPGSAFQLRIGNWQVPVAAQVAIVGPSGSGKTTLLHLMAGILRATSGTIDINGVNVAGISDSAARDFRAAKVGLVFQRFELVDYLNVRQNITLPFSINRSLSLDGAVKDRVETLARRVGIHALLARRVQRLSQGEQQRVAICRALVTRPQIVLADEPTGNLDPENKQIIVDLLKQECQQQQSTLIMVTHDVSLVQQFSQQVDFRQWRQPDADRQETVG